MSNDSRELTALDWIGVTATVGLVGALMFVSLRAGPTFAAMFQELGAELSLLTKLAVNGWLPAGVAVVAVGLSLLGSVLRGASVRSRRLLIVLGFVAAVVGSIVTLTALYEPIFELAEAIE